MDLDIIFLLLGKVLKFLASGIRTTAGAALEELRKVDPEVWRFIARFVLCLCGVLGFCYLFIFSLA